MKFFGAIVFLSVAVYSNGEPQVSDKSAVSKINIANAIELARETLKQGNEELGIPVCEPLQIDNYNFTVDESAAKLVGSLSDLNIAGLTDFTIDSASLSILSMKLTFGFTWPTITWDTGYGIDGTVASAIPIYGNGRASGDLTNLRVSGTAKVSIKNSYVNIKSLSIKIKLEGINLVITGLLGDDDTSALISAAVSDLLPQVIDDYEKEITNVVSSAILKVANQYLSTKTVSELINSVKG